MKLINPTGKSIRMDSEGSGYHRAPRGTHLHDGIDLVVTVGQEILAPITGIVTRLPIPYANESYKGIEITGKDITLVMFYLTPNVPINSYVQSGLVIGTAQDISSKYSPNMKPHIHLRITNINPLVFMEDLV